MNVTHVNTPRRDRDGHIDTAGSALEYRCYHSFQDVSHLKEAWDELALRTGDILCTFDWCEVWWRHFGSGRRLEIHALQAGGRLVAVLPLFRETIWPGGVWLRTVRVLGCDYTIGTVGLAVEPEHAEAFMDLVLDRLSADAPWDVLQIGALRSYNTVTEPMAAGAARRADIQTVIQGRQDNWCTLFELPKTYEEFLRSLPGKTRNEVNRRQRQLAEGHTVTTEVVTAPERVQPTMDLLVKFHQKRWHSKGQPGHFGSVGDVEGFHRELAQRLLPTGHLLLLVLKADDQALSITYGYRFGQRLHALFGSHCYDEKWQRFGIGRIMYTELIRQAIADGTPIVEDGRGVFEHKLSLGGQLHGERSLTLVRAGRSTRVRFWVALRIMYVLHVLYSRLWVDIVAPRLGIHSKGRDFHVRYGVFAQIYRRVRFGLLRGPSFLEARCPEPLPASQQQPQQRPSDRQGAKDAKAHSSGQARRD